MESLHPEVIGFIQFCVHRSGGGWLSLYDEMCRVAGRGLYQGLGYKELREFGLSLSLNNIEETVKKVEAVTASTMSPASLESPRHNLRV